jgi:hypothetical protein
MSAEDRSGASRIRGAWRMILANYAFRALAGIAGASAMVDLVAPVVAQRPDGDRDLFANGSALFVGMGLRALPRMASVATTEALVLIGVAILGVVPFAGLLHALVEPHETISGRARAALRFGLKLALLLGVFALLEVICIAGAVLASSVVARPADSPASLVSALALALLGVVPLGFVALLHDLARVAVVARGAAVLASIRRALRVLWRRPAAVLLAALGASALSLVCAAAGFAAAWIGLRSNTQIIAVLVAQQLAILAIVTVRAAYFNRLITVDREVG